MQSKINFIIIFWFYNNLTQKHFFNLASKVQITIASRIFEKIYLLL